MSSEIDELAQIVEEGLPGPHPGKNAVASYVTDSQLEVMDRACDDLGMVRVALIRDALKEYLLGRGYAWKDRDWSRGQSRFLAILEMGQCKVITKAGRRCKRPVVDYLEDDHLIGLDGLCGGHRSLEWDRLDEATRRGLLEKRYGAPPAWWDGK